MKKLLLIFGISLSLIACKDNGGITKTKDNKSITIDQTNECYGKSLFFDIQYTLNSGKNDTLKHISRQPNFNQCVDGKWCLLDAKTSNVIAKDVKSYKVLSQYLDTTVYLNCSK